MWCPRRVVRHFLSQMMRLMMLSSRTILGEWKATKGSRWRKSASFLMALSWTTPMWWKWCPTAKMVRKICACDRFLLLPLPILCLSGAGISCRSITMKTKRRQSTGNAMPIPIRVAFIWPMMPLCPCLRTSWKGKWMKKVSSIVTFRSSSSVIIRGRRMKIVLMSTMRVLRSKTWCAWMVIFMY